jgi:hypothetical protein
MYIYICVYIRYLAYICIQYIVCIYIYVHIFPSRFPMGSPIFVGLTQAWNFRQWQHDRLSIPLSHVFLL